MFLYHFFVFFYVLLKQTTLLSNYLTFKYTSKNIIQKLSQQQSKLILLFVAFCSVFLYEHVLACLRQTENCNDTNFSLPLLYFVADKTKAKPVYKVATSERSAINQVEVKFSSPYNVLKPIWIWKFQTSNTTIRRVLSLHKPKGELRRCEYTQTNTNIFNQFLQF